MLYSVQSVTTGNDLWVLPLFGDRKPTPVAQTAAHETRGRFSPDGRWVAYESNESGRSEIYVQAFPELDSEGADFDRRRHGAGLAGRRTRIVFRLAGRSTDGGADRGERNQLDTDTPSVLVRPAAGPTSLPDQCRAVRRCS